MNAVLFYLAAFLIASGLSAAVPCAAARDGRFFLMGSGHLHLENLRNTRQAHIKLLDDGGAIDEEALRQADWVFGFPTTEKEEHISPRLLFMLSYFSDLVAPGKTIHIESAYRSPDYNATLRSQGANAARTSTHIDGMALDFWIEGVDGKALWEIVREKNCCGAGHYGGKAVHLDAGRPRFWEAATSGTRTAEPDYNRHIFLTTDYDRYQPGEKVRLSLSGVSTFGFGIRPTGQLSGAGEAASFMVPILLPTAVQKECLELDTRKATRFLYTTLPNALPAGRYRLQLEFCQKPFPQMIDTVLSSEIEVIR